MKLKLGIIILLSVLHDSDRIENSHYNLISGLRKDFDISFIDIEDVDSVDLPIVFIGSGGIENCFKNIYDRLPKPVVLLADGMQNSLAASIEILAWIRELGDDSIILHGSIEEMISQIKYSYKVNITRKSLKESVIGVVGFPSDWLIASDVNYIDVQKKWGVMYKNIGLHEIARHMDDVIIDKAERIAREFINGAVLIKEANENDIIEGAKIYLALKGLIRENELNAVTVQCFELISNYRTTICLALSLLNNEDIVSGCEGDCQSVFSMLLLNLLTGSKAFMANPCRINFEKNEIVLAHCTIPTSMTEKYIIRNHFESLMGVGIQGIVEEGLVTVFKCGGSKLDKYFLASGQIIENLNEDNMCRTQLKIHLDADIRYFLRNPIANHHIIIKGDHTELIDQFMRDMDCTRVM